MIKHLAEPTLQTAHGRLYAGDCLDIMPALPSESVDCFFADPPFNLRKYYGDHVDDDQEASTYLSWCYDWIDQGIRLLKPGGSFFLYNIPKWNILLAAYLSQRLTFRHWITIDIKFSLPIPGRLYPSHYALLYFAKGKKPNTFAPPRLPLQTCRHCGGEIKDYGGYKDKMNPRGVSLTDVWTDIPPVRHSKYKNREANELSLKMMDRVLDIASVPGDVVFDPFGGSGTTFVAAELKDRSWLGTEVATAGDIVRRFADIEDDRRHLDALRQNINVLFTESALEVRRKNGRTNGKFRVNNVPLLAHAAPLPVHDSCAQLELVPDMPPRGAPTRARRDETR